MAAEVEPDPELVPVPVLVPVPELAPTLELVAAGVTGAAAGVTGAAAEVTGAAAEVEPDPELVSVPVPTLEPVTAEVTGDAAEVTGAVAELTLEPELTGRVGGLVAAFACREKTSKTTRIPAAAIATCIARRAMSRTIGCGISSSPLSGQNPQCPSSATRNTRANPNSGPFLCRFLSIFFPKSPGNGHCGPAANVHTEWPSPYGNGLGPGGHCGSPQSETRRLPGPELLGQVPPDDGD